MNRHAVRAQVFDLVEPEEEAKWGFVSGSKTGLRHRHDSLPKSRRESDQSTRKGRHQQSSPLRI
tara:strand:- start:5598 stop:5789 length:192 start_codon:yes stop_codon:yes gene_type:complete